MSVRIDLAYWTKKYEENYPISTEGKYPIFIDEKGVEHEERSPYFGMMSRVLQKRGYLLKKEFVSVGNWKTERQKGRYENNSDEKVENLTRRALDASENEKIKILDKLEGVGVPVASAILTVVYPKKYCIIDYRTWRALLWLRKLAKNRSFSFSSYKEYSDLLDLYDRYGTASSYFGFLGTLKDIGEKWNMTARQVEMALWKFDQMKGEKPKNDS